MGFRITRRRFAGALFVAAVLAGGAGYALKGGLKGGDAAARAQAGPAQGPLEFGASELAYVTATPMARWLPLSGTLAPVNQATVKAKVSGDVKQVNVREGESVRAGQVLARIDTADLEAKLIERQGALESARAQMALAEKTRATNVKLLNEKFISQNAFDSSQSGYDVAKGSVKSAEAQVRLAENALKDALVVAPIDGVVHKRHVQPGEKVAFDAPIVTVVDLADLELQALVPAIDIPGLAAGMPVELAVDGFGERARDQDLRGAPQPRRRAAQRDVRDRARRARRERADRDAADRRRAHRGGPELRLDDRGRQARAPHRRARAPRRGRRARRDPHSAARDGAGARLAVRQPEGRRARARQGADLVAERDPCDRERGGMSSRRQEPVGS